MITVDPAMKKLFINIFLMTPKSTVINAMRQANFTEENIANITMRRYLQRALMGYYLVKWLSEPYTLTVDTEEMAGLIGTGKMVADALYFNRVQRAPYLYTLLVENTIVEVRYVLQTGVQM